MFGLIPFYGRRKSLRPIFSDVENFMERVFNEDLFWVPIFGQPFKADVKETEHEYIVEAELPGIEKENIIITYDDGALNISVKQDTIIDETRENFIRKERRSGSIERRFFLEGVEEEKISATYKNGLLTVKLPKKEAGLKRGKHIPIED
ncbi:HSP20-like chaperone [Moorella glycerini]|uniref:Acid shock protein n=1 Tax=Neomoorella stamsii TaxID=1266720 RepID=A0A9X7P5L6_9FIRM|nr:MULTISPECIES: Hsp20/alpha crystallin family protein [Moorella]PRR71725.1 Acid shock protein [Moorella stamsii]CEP66897.1 HSP20-like chaperone [Moorella glycerini]CEP67232.1 HSP20-like chaperone [Moorella glycerini]